MRPPAHEGVPTRAEREQGKQEFRWGTMRLPDGECDVQIFPTYSLDFRAGIR